MKEDTLFGKQEYIEKTYEGRRATPAPIGTGKKGETCKTCANCVYKQWGSKRFYKCLIMKPCWSNAPGSDIRLKWEACRYWKPLPHQ